MTFRTFLNEIHYSDIYPKGFHLFYNKWKSKKKDNRLFVNFTSLSVNDVLDIKFPTTSTIKHNDPLGIYCYPLKYIIDNPSDVWYGRGAKNIRLFEVKTFDRILFLQELSKEDWLNIFRKRFNIKTTQEYNEHIKRLNKFKKDKRKNFNSSIFTFMQYKDYEKDELFNGEEQTKFWLSLGYNGIYDTANTQNKAIINDREPNQIIFFNKKEIKMVDMQLLDIKSTYVSSGGIGKSEDINKIKRKLAQSVFEKIDDKINDNKDSFFYSKKGRYIEIEFFYTDEYMDTHNFGDKKHRETKFHDFHYVRINFFSEKGEINYSSTINDKFESIAKEIVDLWNEREIDNNFIPIYNKEEHEEIRNKKLQKRLKNDKIKLIKKYTSYIEKLCDIYKVRWKNMTDDEYYILCMMIINIQQDYEYNKTFEIDEIFGEYKTGLYLENKEAIDIMKDLLYKIYTDEEEITVKTKSYSDETEIFKIKDKLRTFKTVYGFFDMTYYLIFKDVYFWKTGEMD